MFVCPVMFFAILRAILLSRLSCHVLGRPHNGAVVPPCVSLGVFYRPLLRLRWHTVNCSTTSCAYILS